MTTNISRRRWLAITAALPLGGWALANGATQAVAAQGHGAPQLANAAAGTINNQLVAVTSEHRLFVRDPVPQNVNWLDVGHANDVVGIAYLGGLLWAATTDNRIWVRPPITPEIDWAPFSQTDHPVTALTAADGRLWALTTNQDLQVLNPSNTAWTDIGAAPSDTVTAITALNGRIWATTTTNELWWRSTTLTSTNWTKAGHANGVTALAALGGYLWAATTDDRLWRRSSALTDVSWTHVGHAIHVTEMTAVP
jgi:hypothetical protein